MTLIVAAALWNNWLHLLLLQFFELIDCARASFLCFKNSSQLIKQLLQIMYCFQALDRVQWLKISSTPICSSQMTVNRHCCVHLDPMCIVQNTWEIQYIQSTFCRFQLALKQRVFPNPTRKGCQQNYCWHHTEKEGVHPSWFAIQLFGGLWPYTVTFAAQVMELGYDTIVLLLAFNNIMSISMSMFSIHVQCCGQIFLIVLNKETTGTVHFILIFHPLPLQPIGPLCIWWIPICAFRKGTQQDNGCWCCYWPMCYHLMHCMMMTITTAT